MKIRTKAFRQKRVRIVFESGHKEILMAFIQYISFLLSTINLLQHWKREGKQWFYEEHINETRSGSYETMLRAVAQSPQKMEEINYVIKKINDKEIIPPEFEHIYQIFLKASRRAVR